MIPYETLAFPPFFYFSLTSPSLFLLSFSFPHLFRRRGGNLGKIVFCDFSVLAFRDFRPHLLVAMDILPLFFSGCKGNES